MILTDEDWVLDEMRGLKNLNDYFELYIDEYNEMPAITDEYSNVEMTFKQVKEFIYDFAGGLQHLGINKGDFVDIFTETTGIFMPISQAVLKLGAIEVLRGSKAPIEELDYIMNHVSAKAIILQNVKILEVLKDNINAKNPEFIIMMYDKGLENFDKTQLNMPLYTREDIVALGKEYPYHKVYDVTQETPCTMLYTSGTTGNPKGVLLTHGNMLSQMEGNKLVFQGQRGEKTLQIIPIWHAYERIMQFFYMATGCHLYFSNVANLKNDLLKYHVNTMMFVPRIWEALRLGVYQKLKQTSQLAYWLFVIAVQNSIKYKIHKMYSERRITNKISDYNPISNIYHTVVRSFLKPFHVLATNTLYKKVKEATGLDKIRVIISGGGALSIEDDLFYDAIGINLRAGYGLTETTLVLTFRGLQYPNYLGCVGKPYVHTKIKIVDPVTFKKVDLYTKGLVLVKGPQVMNGYYNDEEATNKVFTPDGWFITGDLGWLTRDNNLVLVGRMKETIVLSNGENVEPMPIEEAILQSPYIDKIVLVGQDEASVGALIVPSKMALEKCGLLAKDLKSGKTLSIKDTKLRELINHEIKTYIKRKAGLKPFEKVKCFEVLNDDFSMENGLLSCTAKIKRNEVFEKYKTLISSMFAETK